MNITPQHYITDTTNAPVAVVLDIATFRHIEETLENSALVELMQPEREEDSANEVLTLEQAKTYYQSLPKAQ